MAPGNGNAHRRPISLPPIALDTGLDFRFPELREGLDYWRAKAAGRAMPVLSDIRPEEIPRLLPYLTLFDMNWEQGSFSIFPRLAGSKFEEVFGPIHKKPLHTVLPPEILERWHGAARTVIEAGVPLHAAGEVLHEDKSFIAFELLLAPLSRTGEALDTLYLVSNFDMPALGG